MIVIIGGLAGETGSAETERRVKPQGGYVFRGDMDVFRTSIRTATGTGTKQQGEKTRNVAGGEEKDEEIECERKKKKKKKRGERGRACVLTSICHPDIYGAPWCLNSN